MVGDASVVSPWCVSSAGPSVGRIVILFLTFILLVAALSGCSSGATTANDEYRKTGQLQDFRNDIEIDAEQAANPGIVRGTITRTEASPNGLLVMVKVSSFRVIATSNKDEDSTPARPGTEVVIETRSSAEGLSPGKTIEAVVRFGKATTGMRLIAESVRLEEP